MVIQGINNKWNLLAQADAVKNEDLKRLKDIDPNLQDQQIKTDSVDLSKEGMEALRAQVQSMPGHIDVAEMMMMDEILPKLKMNPTDEFLWSMRNDIQNSLNAVKQSKGSYTLEDLITIRMEAYTRQYDALCQSYAEGSRDIYLSDGFDENGKWQYHKVTQAEDISYLNEAFDRIADSLGFAANAQEKQWQIDEKFYGKAGLPISLPEGYGERLAGLLKQAADQYTECRNNGQRADAGALALGCLQDDAEFADAMNALFSNIKPMP